MIASLLKRNIGIILITCFVLGFFALQSPSIAGAQATSSVSGTEARESGENVDPAAEIGFTAPAKFVYEALTGIGSWVTWFGGLLLDVSLSWFVWGMAETTTYFHLNDVINTVWALVRDLFNLLFIFGFIYIGFQLILGADDNGSKRTLGTLIVAALLINFSLYAAQVVVDFGNIAAIEISGHFSAASNSEVMGRPLSNINELSTGVEEVPSSGIGIGQALVIGLTVALMLIVLGFVFAAGAVLMMVRYFYLIFLMMFSPLMVLGFVLPQFRSKSSEWWNTLFKQVLIGPAYLFMLYISLLALQAFSSAPSNQSITTFIMMSLMVSGFAWASLIVAQKIGALGASQAIGFGQGIGKKVRGGVTGLVGRNTIGRMADSYSRRLEERGVSDKSWRRSAASSLAGNKFGGSYSRSDARSSDEKAAQKGARRAQVQKINSAISAGGSPAATRDQIIKMEEAITGASNDQLIEMLGKHKEDSIEYKKIVENMSASQFDAVMKAKPEELDDKAKEKLAEKRGAHVTAAVTGTGGIGIKNADESQLKMLGEEAITNNILELKQSQFDKIMDSKDYTATQKDRFKKARKDGLINEFGTGVTGTGVAEGSKAATFFATYGGNDKAVAKLPEEILKSPEAAEHLRSSALRQMLHDGLDVNTRALIRANISRSSNADAKKWLTPAGRNSSSEGQLF